MFGDGWLGEAELKDQFGDIALAGVGKEIDDLTPTGLTTHRGGGDQKYERITD